MSPKSPRIRVAALILIDRRVLLVRHRKGDERYHLLPGGGVDWGESLADALVREVAEETGLGITIGRPLILADSISPDGDRHLLNVVFQASITCGAPACTRIDPRVEDVELVEVAELDELDLRPPLASVLREALSDPAGFQTRYLSGLWSA